MSSIKSQKKIWEGHGESDPLWAILTDPRRKGGKWKESDFFKTGKDEITKVFTEISKLKIRTHSKGRALDFGCGMGRLTQALGRRFSSADGVDISNAMILGARRYNRLGKRVRYHVNAAEGLPLFGASSFDFIYASIVLQHIPVASTEGYLKDFLRVLKPGGLLVFNLPFARRVPFTVLWRYRLRLRTRLKQLAQRLGMAQDSHFDPHPIPMRSIPEARVQELLSRAGGTVLCTLPVNTTNDSFYDGLKFYKENPEEDWYPSLMYIVQKNSSKSR